ncbi:class II aldolase/adducin family protein [Streptomyces sp. NPDC000987]|uniref:class II aldolase/adducin family protein n=1 Tax=Streptomyces sp. NPDC000987 TaxID=3154374 RepID=UPI00332ABFD5
MRRPASARCASTGTDGRPPCTPHRAIPFQALVHAQPPHLTYLSHIPACRTTQALNSRILRWEREAIVSLPEGVVVLGFMVPGSAGLQAATAEGLREAQVVLWSKHGVMARSDLSVAHAVDRIEYAETGARYECMDLVAGRDAGRSMANGGR